MCDKGGRLRRKGIYGRDEFAVDERFTGRINIKVGIYTLTDVMGTSRGPRHPNLFSSVFSEGPFHGNLVLGRLSLPHWV